MSSFEIVCGFRCETVEKFNIAVKEIILVGALLSTVDDLVCAAKHIALCGAFADGYSNECLSVLVGHVARHLPCAVAASFSPFFFVMLTIFPFFLWLTVVRVFKA